MAEVVHRVSAEAEGQRLDHLLASLHPDISRSQLQAWIEEGIVLLDGREAKASRKLRGGERITLTIPERAPSAPRAQDLPLSILYEDEDLLVVDKAPGMVVHPAAGVWEGTLLNALLFHVKGIEGVGDGRAGIVHRLDKDTSGCVVVAKREEAFSKLQKAFKERRVERRYVALVHGVPKESAFTLDTPFGRHPTDRVRFTSRRPVGPERRAITHVRVLERFRGASLLEVRLETGRTHQIRVHLSDAGHPLLGDPVYGGLRREARLRGDHPVRLAAKAIGRQALHAKDLGFQHPSTGEALEFDAPIPADFRAGLEILRG